MGLRLGISLSFVFAIMAALVITLPVSAASKTCFGQAATVQAANGVYTLTNGNDVVVGTSKGDYVTTDGAAGAGGTDFICTGSGADTIYITLDGGSATIDTGSGSDNVIADGTGALTVSLGSGNDYIQSTVPNASIDGGSGNDTVVNGGTGSSINAGSGNDKVSDLGPASTIDCGPNVDHYSSIGTPVVTRCEKPLVS